MFSEYFEFDDAQYLTRTQVARILGIHPSTVTRWVESNDLPLPIRLGPNRTVWSRRELEAWRGPRNKHLVHLPQASKNPISAKC